MDNNKKVFSVFLISITILNLVQATFTELLPDEAYYYMYSTRLAFGYFDHPPMIALLIKIGEFFTHSEFGVRITSVLMNSATLYIIYKLAKPKNVLIFIFLYLNFIAFQALGFFAVPDIPLMFFTACFLWTYDSFISKQIWSNSILLALTCAALIYSKYHGFLVIGFALLSQPKLFTNYKIYIVGILALAFLSPHILWQINNKFPSIKYHLAYRFDGGISAENILGYILGQLAFIGPIGIYAIAKSNFTFKDKSPLLKTSIFISVGFLLFFLAASFNGRIEANWTAAAFVPFMILAVDASDRLNFKLVKNSAIALFIIILPLRAYLMVDFLPKKINYQYQRHGWKKWAEIVKAKAKSANLIFQDSYQKTSMYTFYANAFAYSPNSFGCRKNQFDIWSDMELQVQGKPALVIPNWENSIFDSINNLTVFEKMSCLYYNNYRSYTKVQFKTEKSSYIIKHDTPINIKFCAFGPSYIYNTIDNEPTLTTQIGMRVFFLDKDSNANYLTSYQLKDFLCNEKSKSYKVLKLENHGLPKGKYKFILHGKTGTLGIGICNTTDLVIE